MRTAQRAMLLLAFSVAARRQAAVAAVAALLGKMAAQPLKLPCAHSTFLQIWHDFSVCHSLILVTFCLEIVGDHWFQKCW